MRLAKQKEKSKKKLIDIPEKSLAILAKKSTEERMPVKAYMEKVLIDHANSISK